MTRTAKELAQFLGCTVEGDGSTPVSGVAAPASALPEGVREGNENLVRLTEAAGAKVRVLVAREQQGEYLRVAISGGGCNGCRGD